MKLISYSRVSTNTQEISIDAQRRSIKSYCEVYGHDIIQEISESKSASTASDRPGLMQAMTAVKAGVADGIIFYKLDRLTRSVRDLGMILDEMNGKAIISVMDQFDTTCATGRLVLNVMVSISQWERETISERTKFALDELRAQGRVSNKLPYGMKSDGGKLVPCEVEQVVIKRAMELSGVVPALSLRRIAGALSSEGMFNRNGKPFHAEEVRRIIDGRSDNQKIRC